MYSIVSTATVCGIESIPIQVEADVCDGMPVFEMVGELSSEVKESRERMKAAIRNSGIRLAPKRITINLYPADIRKSGTGFDLPITLAVLSAYGLILAKHLEGIIFAGEISLNGDLHPIHGILPIVLAAQKAGYTKVCVPRKNVPEAEIVKGITILPGDNLKQVIATLNGTEEKQKGTVSINIEETNSFVNTDNKEEWDFDKIHGQKVLKRVCEIAAAGRHNLLMLGPPGTGKTMAARGIPGILPPLMQKEAIELAKIYSVCGMFEQRAKEFTKRPFRSPHHTISSAGLAGGGTIPKPGEISLAHKGVLFLDELTEFQKSTLEILRQPLEEKIIRLVRLKGSCEYPADIMLVAAMNPCSCGYYPDKNRCTCTSQGISRYLNKISKPFLDRMDICVEVPRMELLDLIGGEKEESSKTIQNRVMQVQKIQQTRFQETTLQYNSQIPSNEIEQYCPMTLQAQKLLQVAFESMELSARGYYKVIKVARTIADLEQSKYIQDVHMSESLLYRNLDRKVWESV
ncbi:MAG: YifB family Mg chelatase-like AAA ATPase [Lachnospiraceae bacterium]